MVWCVQRDQMMLEEEKELLEEEKELLEERVRELIVQLEQTQSTKVGPGGPVVVLYILIFFSYYSQWQMSWGKWMVRLPHLKLLIFYSPPLFLCPVFLPLSFSSSISRGGAEHAPINSGLRTAGKSHMTTLHDHSP